ncbi:hypothetical protein GQ57_24885 [Burkholderia sp. MSh2]|uniref:Amino acid adenylation domain-containing protein n=1 Tax=Burkholderia paludis TaxID=1506587 RepID=A0A6P2IVC1_9BURK|nr:MULTISPECIES: amino acid adenylation domain-containing protein [Burkholderia]KEZ03252.1 hypothetical protein GQ57_24885 [Burkholderia sp. MSh2]CAB3754954.1 Tyrocidine synthase 1 [Burkholderia paludis]VWB33713.1 amino acid adenylation domain-containing protein [Burkholderia paludis]
MATQTALSAHPTPIPAAPVHDLIRERVRERPDAPAVIDGAQRLTYAELDAASDALAARLVARGAGPETPVGVTVRRSTGLFVALLAVLKAGAAFVPLDAAYPRERLDYIAADAGIALWLVGPGVDVSPGFDAARVVRLDATDDGAPAAAARLPAAVHERQLAYLIYTSGSTGAPKGVAVEHGPLSMHCRAIVERYGIVERDVVLHFASVNFDGAHEGWLAPLVAGAAIVVSGDALWDAAQTVDAIRREAITAVAFPPSYLRQVAEWCAEHDIRLPSVRSYTTGGEAMSRETHAVIDAALAPPRLVNGYGPTETVITPLLWTSHDPSGLGDSAYLPIGTPVGARHVALDPAAGDDTPSDRPRGELLIGGYGVARGYHRRPALTAERFEPDPDGAPGARRYRSGDLVEALPAGGYAYLGRTDDQIKLRGLRIEPGEIERCLLGCDGVREAAVVVRDTPAGRQLVGYLASGRAALPDVDAARERLRASLPPHMVPSSLVALAALPRLPNGKLDRLALPAPVAPRAAYRAPSTDVERALAALWQALFGVEQVGADDHFFELGGDSLSAASLQARIRESLHPEFELAALFDTPRLADLAARIARERGAAQDAEADALAEIDALLNAEESATHAVPR